MDRMVHMKSGRLKIYVHMSFIFSSILEILDIWLLYVWKKRRAPKNDEECPDVRAEISHMRPIQGQTLKLFITPFCGVINLPVEWFTPEKVYHSTLANSLQQDRCAAFKWSVFRTRTTQVRTSQILFLISSAIDLASCAKCLSLSFSVSIQRKTHTYA